MSVATSTRKIVGLIEKTLASEFAAENVKAKPYNPASIRVRIISDRFDGLTRSQREAIVNPILKNLPAGVQSDIIFLLLLTPQEVESSYMNQEFERPARITG